MSKIISCELEINGGLEHSIAVNQLIEMCFLLMNESLEELSSLGVIEIRKGD